jgi:hypothetical protein
MQKAARRSIRARSAGLAGYAVVGLLFLGCSKPPAEESLREVKVKVVYKDVPASFVIITLHPADAKVQKQYTGGTEKDGLCTVNCPAGKYRVTMTRMPLQNNGPVGAGTAGGGATTPVPDEMFERYRYVDRTPWRDKTVSDSDVQDMNLVVE